MGLSMARPGDSLAELLEWTDAVLDAARRQGGNGVVVGGELNMPTVEVCFELQPLVDLIARMRNLPRS
jgi:hypothetical protein